MPVVTCYTHSLDTLTRLSWVTLLLISFASHGQERDWWFEVELLVFKRDTQASTLNERFEPGLRTAGTDNSVDLFSAYLKPDINQVFTALPSCHVPEPELPSIEQILQMYETYLAEQAALMQATSVVETDVLFDELLSDDTSEQERVVDEFEDSEPLADSEIPIDEPFTEPYLVVEQQPVAQPPTEAELLAAEQARIAEQQALIAEQWQTFYQAWYEFITPQGDNPIPELQEDFSCQWNTPDTVFEPQLLPAFDSLYDNLPVKPRGTEWIYQLDPHLLHPDSLQLNNLFTQIRRSRDLIPLLHTGWRQKVLFGRDVAPFYRLFAGQDYATLFDQDGEPLPVRVDIDNQPSDTLLTGDNQGRVDSQEPDTTTVEQPTLSLTQKVQLALASPGNQVPVELLAPADDQQGLASEDRTPLWELDGRFKVYLQYINRVPYLHIDSQLDYRSLVSVDGNNDPTNMTLQSFPFDQLRRVISTQIHYFDHPLFGFVVQIRRYTPPEPPQEDPQEENE